jgi:hypothetical protein
MGSPCSQIAFPAISDVNLLPATGVRFPPDAQRPLGTGVRAQRRSRAVKARRAPGSRRASTSANLVDPARVGIVRLVEARPAPGARWVDDDNWWCLLLKAVARIGDAAVGTTVYGFVPFELSSRSAARGRADARARRLSLASNGRHHWPRHRRGRRARRRGHHRDVYGRVRFQVTVPEGWMLRSVTHDTRDLTDGLLELGSGETVSGVDVQSRIA